MQALGPLGLRHEDLWHITRGELEDLIVAYNYRRHLELEDMALAAIFTGLAFGGDTKQIYDLLGSWTGNTVMNRTQKAKFIKDIARAVREAKQNGEKSQAQL
ncbi:hypothetical protein [uncultured Cloacibacillus sp.]|uniref:hypothetical protein n=1 Tax=uncultured Cloacibacillus sp. TaxID=889794 RepID=UPI0027D956B6|nr:hypothetical protein [uncultured Cloacibacillus sp.]